MMGCSSAAVASQGARALGARALSSAATHQPPKKITGTHGRYAAAVYTAASKAGLLDKVEHELSAFNKILADKPDFAHYLTNPTISRTVKSELVASLVGDEKKVSFITRNLFMTLAANNRLAQTSNVVKAYLELVEASRGVIPAIVTTAEPLSKKTLTSIQDAILKIVGSEKKVDLQVKEDPALLGGLQVQIGDRFLDLSVASRIGDLRRTLADAEI